MRTGRTSALSETLHALPKNFKDRALCHDWKLTIVYEEGEREVNCAHCLTILNDIVASFPSPAVSGSA